MDAIAKGLLLFFITTLAYELPPLAITQLTRKDVKKTIKRAVESNKTMFVRIIESSDSAEAQQSLPVWKKVVRMFEEDITVKFAEINLAVNSIFKVHGKDLEAGTNGWPTYRFYNRLSGLGGESYTLRTQKKLVDELSEADNVIKFVTQMGGTSMCNVRHETYCLPPEIDFIRKWKGKSARAIRNKYEEYADQERKAVETMRRLEHKFNTQEWTNVKEYDKQTVVSRKWYEARVWATLLRRILAIEIGRDEL